MGTAGSGSREAEAAVNQVAGWIPTISALLASNDFGTLGDTSKPKGK